MNTIFLQIVGWTRVAPVQNWRSNSLIGGVVVGTIDYKSSLPIPESNLWL